MKQKKYLKKKNLLRCLKIFGLFKIYNYFKNMIEENISQEIEQNELMSRKHKKVCTTLNYIKNVLILASVITGCISISAICFFAWYSYGNYVFCNRIKHLCNSCIN